MDVDSPIIPENHIIQSLEGIVVNVYHSKSGELICKHILRWYEIGIGYFDIDCLDCNGTGIFQLPDGEEKCVACKGTGKQKVPVF